MERTLALTSAAALALSVAAIEPVEAHPLLLVAPVASSGISAGWAAAAGLGGVLLGTALANPHYWAGGCAPRLMPILAKVTATPRQLMPLANEGSQKEPSAATCGGCALHSPSTAVDSRG
jgi:hypothetical protein